MDSSTLSYYRKGKEKKDGKLVEENLNIFMFGNSNKGFLQSPVEMTKINTMGQLSFDKSDDLCSPLKWRKAESVESACPVGFIERWTSFRIRITVPSLFARTVRRPKRIASHSKIPLKGQPEVLLFEWVDGLTKNVKKVVSYGGWLAVKGLPLSWWSSKFFKLIGDICGGLIEVDKRTANLKSLYEARIKARENVSGFLPEWVKLSEGEQSYIVHIQPLSPAIQSLNIRKREQQFQSFL
ncbi:hypothetical protein M0R45_005415 [Rubus argutus]|uniref:DUF4283 domain-containing protein n=1 Tax=Rubus argutus TaxID=59490 RepID=A0AAW1YME2_RUBAR